jgi:replication factor C subunit 2/4
MKERLRFIATAEGCTVTEAQLSTVLTLSEGDMRRAVTTLQSVQALMVGMSKDEDADQKKNRDTSHHTHNHRDTVVDETVLAELAGLPPPAVIQQLVTAMKSKLFDTVKDAVQEVCANGYSAQFVLQGLLQQWVLAKAATADDDNDSSKGSKNKSNDLSELSKAKLAIRMAEAEANMMDGADEYLQLMTVCGLGMECLVQQGSSSSNIASLRRNGPPEQ